MPNVYTNYNETFFAQEALIQLEDVMGLAGRVYRDYNADPQTKGDTIKVRRPASFAAADAPSVAQDVKTEGLDITLNKWREVKFKLTDKDLSLTSDRIISDHIRPAAIALAGDIDRALAALYTDIPWYTTLTGTPVLSDITAVRALQFANKVPLDDAANMHFMVGGTAEAAFLNALGASGMQPRQQDGAVRRGEMGSLFGYNIWANQNTPVHTSGTAADAVGTVDAVNAIGVTAMTVSAVSAGITVKKGDSFSLAGDTQRYVVAADATDADGAAFAITFSPALKEATTIGQVITFHLGGANKTQNLAFHRNAFCLAMAPLSDIASNLGARVSTVADPKTGLALRSRLYYVGDSSEVHVALDVLYGVKTLDPNLAVRAYAA